MADLSSAFFLPVDPGSRFCIYHAPANRGGPGCGVVYVHPFGEEMNKARRMAALQARRLSATGCGVLQIDLLGCGDSTGEFVDARWQVWKRDVQAAVGWLKRHLGGPVGLWGLRLGATLAVDVARDPDMGIEHLLLWHPVASGEQFLTQFLRLHLASEMLSRGTSQTGVRELRDKLAGGASLEIAGYELHPDLASAINDVRLAAPAPAVKSAHWLEVTAQAEPCISPASRLVLDAWRVAGLDASEAAVTGEPFWSTLEIVECEALLDATDEAIEPQIHADKRG